ncbi:MAG TPA: pseudouridine synthase [Stellaceae bacterium]|nr:pseudouridine synthase [Stellaceae bacterium]
MAEAASEAKGERVAKILARAGLCSRRDAERWIAEGRVSLRGEKLTSPAVNVADPAELSVDGKPLPAADRARLWRYHKPAGLVTTHRDEKGRETVFDKLPEGTPRLISVGRLDLNSEGLLLLTNDGELARRLELPANGWLRRYKVRVHGIVDPKRLEALEHGVTIDGVAYGPIHAVYEGEQHTSNVWLTVSLREGRNREIRKVMAHVGLAVTRLIRLAYGPFQLGNLPRGALEEVPPRVMNEQFGDEAKPGTATAEKKLKAKSRRRPRPGKRAREAMRGHAAKGGDAHHRR